MPKDLQLWESILQHCHQRLLYQWQLMKMKIKKSTNRVSVKFSLFRFLRSVSEGQESERNKERVWCAAGILRSFRNCLFSYRRFIPHSPFIRTFSHLAPQLTKETDEICDR